MGQKGKGSNLSSASSEQGRAGEWLEQWEVREVRLALVLLQDVTLDWQQGPDGFWLHSPCPSSAFHQESWEALQKRPGLAKLPRQLRALLIWGWHDDVAGLQGWWAAGDNFSCAARQSFQGITLFFTKH